MNTALAGVQTSPVNMEDRKQLGIKPGDTVRVHQKIQDKGKTRIQVFEGLVLARKHGNEPGATFTVRRVSSNVGVEKIYPLYSPNIDKIEIIKRAKVRRAKLYFIREKVAREIKRQMRRMRMMDLASESEAEATARAEAEAKAAAEEAKQAEEAAAAAETEKAAAEAPAESAPEETPEADTASAEEAETTTSESEVDTTEGASSEEVEKEKKS